VGPGIVDISRDALAVVAGKFATLKITANLAASGASNGFCSSGLRGMRHGWCFAMGDNWPFGGTAEARSWPARVFNSDFHGVADCPVANNHWTEFVPSFDTYQQEKNGNR
jgi:hypothetical protein